MLTTEAYDRLEAAAVSVASHASFRTKTRVVEACLNDVEDRYIRGHLSDAQRARLIQVLNGEALNG